LTAQAVVGGVIGVIASQISLEGKAPLADLLPSLMTSIVLPYRGRAVAQRELNGPAAGSTRRREMSSRSRLAQKRVVRVGVGSRVV
jgi:hypothetical protein